MHLGGEAVGTAYRLPRNSAGDRRSVEVGSAVETLEGPNDKNTEVEDRNRDNTIEVPTNDVFE